MPNCPVPLDQHDNGEHELAATRSGFGTPVHCETCNRYLHPEDRDGGVAYDERD